MLFGFPVDIITARKRSLGQGNIFTSVCQEFCSQGGCLVPGGVWRPPLRDGYCCGWYASYWNAFLFYIVLLSPANEVWGKVIFS